MGIIKATRGAVSGTFADQWKEFFYCDAMDNETLVKRGVTHTSDRSSNTKATSGYITDGSTIAVANGQVALAIDLSRIIGVYDTPGEHRYSSPNSKSSLSGGGAGGVVSEIIDRIGFGGDVPHSGTQRIVYVNTREIMGNTYHTRDAVPVRFHDPQSGLDIDANVDCGGVYSYRIVDAVKFYTVCSGDSTVPFSAYEVRDQMRSELLTCLQPALAKLGEKGIRPWELAEHTEELAEELRVAMTGMWCDLRGIKLVSIGVSNLNVSSEDMNTIQEMQRAAAVKDPLMAAARLNDATAEAVQGAAANSTGAVMGFAGMAAAQQAGATAVPMPTPDTWDCSCSATGQTGNFCEYCGQPRP